MLKNARRLLDKEYQKCLSAVKGSTYYTSFAEEKLRHSLQVLGAGNYILKHEALFQKRDPIFTETAKTAVLLHDIARFDEIAVRFLSGKKMDHGIAGYVKLSQMPEYSHDLIALPIKHHGHLKDEFYNDETYKNIKDKAVAADCDAVFRLIRDADKIANFNIVCSETEKYLPLFIPSPKEVASGAESLSPQVVEDFLSLKTVDYSLRQTCADYFLTFISWFFDLNYQTSAVFCRRLNLPSELFLLLRRYHHDDSLNHHLEEAICKFLNKKFG